MITEIQPNISSQPLQENEGRKITLEVKDGDNNVSTGDKSNNTAVITLSTEGRELSAEVTREQMMNRVDYKMKTKALSNLGSDGGSSPLKQAALISSGVLENGTVEALAYNRHAQTLLDTYSTASQNNFYSANNEDENSYDYSVGYDAQKYHEFSNAYIKRNLFFDNMENSQLSLKA